MAGRRVARLAALVLAALASTSGVAAADEEIIATVAQSAAPDATTLSALEASCQPTYTGPTLELYGPGGTLEPANAIPAQAWTIGTLISSCLPTLIPLSSVTGVTIIGPNGPQSGPDSVLTAADLAQPSDFANPQESPLIADDGDGIEYERPWRGGTDDNAADGVQLTAPEPFELEVFTGPLLQVSVAAPATAVANAPVALTAAVAGTPAGLSYSWSFDGGSGSSTAPAPSVTFSAPGVYRVTLEVTDADGGGGVASATITVGAPATTTSTTSAATPGPVRRVHRHRKRHPRRTPPHPAIRKLAVTPASVPARRSTTTTSRPPKTSTPAATTPSAATTQTTARSDPIPRAPAAAAVPAPASPATAPKRASAPRGPRRTVRLRVAPRRHSRSTSASRQAALVDGRLIADVTPVPPAASPLAGGADAAAVADAARGAQASSPFAAVGGALAVVLLLGLGAIRESRWRRLRSAP